MADSERVRVRVVYALPDRQVIAQLELPPPLTVAQAVSASGLQRQFPEIGAQPLCCAVFGCAVAANHVVRDGDRIEILRPLLIDPKESRRQTAKKALRPKAVRD